MDSPVLRDSAKAAILFFLGVMVIAMVGEGIHTGITLILWDTVLLLVSLVVLVLWRHRKSLSLRSLGALSVTPTPSIIGIAGVLRLISFYQGGVPIQFTRNDMVVNSIEAITAHMCGSLGQRDEAELVSVTAIIDSLFYSPGTDYPDLLIILYGDIVTTIVVCVVAGVFDAWFAFNLLKGVPLPWRIAAALLAGWVPFTHYIFGTVMYQGYMNIPVIYLVLTLTWIMFRTMHTVESMARLALIIVITLATWPPASLISGFLLLLVLLLRLSDSETQRSTTLQLVFLLLSWGFVVVFFLGVSLPSLRADGDYLTTGPGGLAGDFQDHLLLAAIGLMLPELLYRTLVPQRHSAPVLGIGAMTLGGWLSVFYLASLRETGDSPWGYYPLKMLWIITITMVMAVGTELIAQTFTALATPKGTQFSKRKRVLLRVCFGTPSALTLIVGVVLPSSYLGIRKTLMPMLTRDIVVPSAQEKHTYDEFVEVFGAHKDETIAFWRQAEIMEFNGDRNRLPIQFSTPADHDVRSHSYRAWDKHYYNLLCPLLCDWDRDATLITSSKNCETTKNRLSYYGLRHDAEILTLDDWFPHFAPLTTIPTDRLDMLTLFAPGDLSTRNNSLNMLRLVLALLVVFSHAQLLTVSGDGVVISGQHLGS